VKVLVADDNHDAADTLATLLELVGHEVQVVYDGAAAIRAAAAFDPQALICDVGMPGVDGYAVARELRTACGRTPVPLMIACTGYGNATDVRSALEAGFDHHLTKPPSIPELLRLLEPAMAAAGRLS
jgi:CheY-like chemotaxis protein